MPAQNDLDAMDRRAINLFNECRYEEAVEVFSRLIESQPDWEFGDPHYHLGQALTELGRYTEAEESLQTAVKFRPEDPTFWSGLASMYYVSGKLERAEEILLKVKELHNRYGNREAAARAELALEHIRHLL